jgi:hypothetical protein
LGKGRFCTEEDIGGGTVSIDRDEYAIIGICALKLQATNDGNWRKVGSLHLERFVHDAHFIDLLLAKLYFH